MNTKYECYKYGNNDKKLTARHLVEYKVELEGKLWWWKIRTNGYYANTVWAVAWYQSIKNYVINQWYGKKWYKTIHGWTNVSMKQPLLLSF